MPVLGATLTVWSIFKFKSSFNHEIRFWMEMNEYYVGWRDKFCWWFWWYLVASSERATIFSKHGRSTGVPIINCQIIQTEIVLKIHHIIMYILCLIRGTYLHAAMVEFNIKTDKVDFDSLSKWNLNKPIHVKVFLILLWITRRGDDSIGMT